MQSKDLWRAQLNNVNRALDYFLCGDGKYRAYSQSSAQSVLDKVSGIIRSIADTEFTDALITTDYLYAPASTRHHGNFRGGLLCHSLLVTKRLLEFTINNDIEWRRVQSPVLVGMLHDLCKVYAYVVTEDGYKHSNHMFFPVHGHAEKSLAFIVKHGINITEEEMLCILHHMGAYETDSWAEYDAAIKQYPNVLWTHMADMYASKVDGV